MYYIIVFHSISSAYKIKSHFGKYGDYMALMHTPAAIIRGKCSYSLRLKQSKLKEVIEGCERFGIKNQGVYLEVGNGEYKGIKV